ncbi:calcium-transporting ATPase 4, plasma membrane-type isoform X2 [Jatropha curcas]|uniref:calcium-transporting ATPase 4, plasma membrane-type isoform X2 n=1 Tax=Jatropha curcas TaxID=180498 RepID=UPI001892E51B|nr:calcium-transporting ATPase 4, plasma membrane-type isoform X2 [Jatropha curcas]
MKDSRIKLFDMENYLKENFNIPAKHASDEDLKRWRSKVGIVKNPRRRFRGLRNLQERSQAREKQLRNIEDNIKNVFYNQDVALSFTNDNWVYTPPREVVQAGFGIDSVILSSMVSAGKIQVLQELGGIEGVARFLSVSLDRGISTLERPPISVRQKIFGSNLNKEKPPRSFWKFSWEVLQDRTLILLLFCAVASMLLGVSSEGWPNGMHEGWGIIFCTILVILITSITNYRQHLVFRRLVEEKKKISVLVTRDGRKQKLSIYDLVVGDVVHLSVGDQVPADGIYISGNSLLIDASCLSGESCPVDKHEGKPFLLSGTKVLDGSCKMLVASVGKQTILGRLMETLNEWGEDETPLQVKLNSVARVVGNIGLFFSLLVFLVLTQRFLLEKASHNVLMDWSSKDASKLLNYVVIAVSIFMGAFPKGLPLAVILSRLFAMRRLKNRSALVRHPSACEIMGSVSCICTDKTGTLTTSNMTVDKLWICDRLIEGVETSALRSAVYRRVLDVLLQIIFKNTSAEVVEIDDGKTILGSPIESALLEYGLLLDSDFNAQLSESNIVKVVPFHPMRKKMSVVVALPAGNLLVLTKGAPEVILDLCEKVFDCNGEPIPLAEAKRQVIMDIVIALSREGLSTLCFASKEIPGTSDEKELPTNGYTLVAVVGIKNPVRQGVKRAFQACLDAGISICVITGDNMNTAEAVAKECGILTDDGLAIEGSDFRNKRIEEKSLPKVQVAKESADVIMKDDDFTSIVDLIKTGRAVYLNIQKAIQFLLTINIVVLMLSSFSAIISWSAFITPFQLLWVDMVVGILGSLLLAANPPSDSIMQRVPFRKDMDLITPTMWINTIGQSIHQMVVLLIFKINGRSLLNLTGTKADSVLDTFIFNTFVFFQVFNAINNHEVQKLNVFRGLFNWHFFAVMAFIVVSQVIIVELWGSFSNTVPLCWELWVISALLASTSMILAAMLKLIKHNHFMMITKFYSQAFRYKRTSRCNIKVD